MDAVILIRLLLAILVFLLLTVDYTSVINNVYQLTIYNGSAWKPSSADAKAKEKLKKQENFWAEPRIVRTPGFRDDRIHLDLENEIEEDTIEKIGMYKSKADLLVVIKNHCLPKLICEMSATPYKHMLSPNERQLLGIIRDTTVTVYGTITSRYHYAAHMGQLISGIDGHGCHMFYPRCPFQSVQVLKMMRNGRSAQFIK